MNTSPTAEIITQMLRRAMDYANLTGFDGAARQKLVDLFVAEWNYFAETPPPDARAEHRKNMAREVPDVIVKQIIEHYTTGIRDGQPMVMADIIIARRDFAYAYQLGLKGADDSPDCPVCDGSGCVETGIDRSRAIPCAACNGTARVDSHSAGTAEK